MQRARLRCAHFEELRTRGRGFQECARVALDNIAETCQSGYIIVLCLYDAP
jgi:hypothetical protein